MAKSTSSIAASTTTGTTAIGGGGGAVPAEEGSPNPEQNVPKVIPFALNPGQSNVSVYIDYNSTTGIKLFNSAIYHNPLMGSPNMPTCSTRNRQREPNNRDGWKQGQTSSWFLIPPGLQKNWSLNMEDLQWTISGQHPKNYRATDMSIPELRQTLPLPD